MQNPMDVLSDTATLGRNDDFIESKTWLPLLIPTKKTNKIKSLKF